MHRGFCPSCGAKRMVEYAALLVDEILPEAPYRQWVLSVPLRLRLLFATRLMHSVGHTCISTHDGATTFNQRFGSVLNLNVHFWRAGMH